MPTGLPGVGTSAAYVDLLQRTQPEGPYWPTADSVLVDIYTALSVELARLHNRTIDSLEESDPRTTDELLEEWETVLGLDPDGTDAERRAAVAAAYIATGGNSADYFEQLAATMGLTGTYILDQTAGSWLWHPCSPPCMPLYSAYHAFVWEVHSLAAATAEQRAALEALFGKDPPPGTPITGRNIKPAHTHVVFFYDV